jgi:hypothetical protein
MALVAYKGTQFPVASKNWERKNITNSEYENEGPIFIVTAISHQFFLILNYSLLDFLIDRQFID